MWPLNLGHVMQWHASSLACNKRDYSLFLQSKERMKEASGRCKIAQSGMKNLFCAQCRQSTMTPPPHCLKFQLRTLPTLTQVACSYISVSQQLAKCNLALKTVGARVPGLRVLIIHVSLLLCLMLYQIQAWDKVNQLEVKVAGNPEFSRSTNLESKLIEFFVLLNF